ncbi:MAG: OsmC family protein [Stappiaceae bacterium]
MQLRIKQKPYGPIFVKYDGSEVLQYADGKEAEFTVLQPVMSPVESLLAALGACIILSMKMAARHYDVALNPFVVEVAGKKASDLPMRLGHADLKISGDVVSDPEVAANIAARAKSICTVSNSLNCSVDLSLNASIDS